MALEPITVGPNLAKALVAAHKQLRNPKTDSENPYFSSKYVSLAACRDAAIPILAEHGVVLLQDLTTTTLPGLDGQVLVAAECRTILIHESGEGIQLGPFTLPAEKPTAQAMGSCATYSRRYAMNAANSLATDEDDDDGNAATGNGRQADAQTSGRHRPAMACNPTAPDGTGPPIRPTGVFGYGKKFVTTPWNVMKASDLEWFRDADRTPPIIREKCRAELTWREHEAQKADALRQPTGEPELDDKIPF